MVCSSNTQYQYANLEATILSRCTSFNGKNSEEFFDNLQQVYGKYKLDTYWIYNCDEMALPTAQVLSNSQKGLKQVGQVTYGECGTLVNGLFTVNAGNFTPPFYVFPERIITILCYMEYQQAWLYVSICTQR